MRLWSIHPKYLDPKGLVALWREGLLAKAVLEGKTKGYKSHPQLNRFRKIGDPISGINFYLEGVFKESKSRGYNFDQGKIIKGCVLSKISVTIGQIEHEVKHLKSKLLIRDQARYLAICNENKFKTHPSFKIVKGKIEDWERLSDELEI